MSRRKIILGLLALVLCGLFAAAFWPEKEMPEPIYKGRKLSEWTVAATKTSPEAMLALQTIGTNGLPFYLDWIGYKPGISKRAQFKLAGYGNKWFGLKWVPGDTEFTRANGALQALAMLGEGAEPAIPQFIAFATNVAALHARTFSVNDPLSGYLGLAQIGRPAVPAFLFLMTNQDPRVRASAVTMSMQNYDTSLVAQVRASLQDKDYRVRSAATNVMRTYDPDFGSPIDTPKSL
jgi:hypothetical protein